MRISGRVLPLALTLVCMSALAYEWRPAGATTAAPAGTPVQPRTGLPAASSGRRHADAQMTAILERPLFAATRRAPSAAPGSTPGQAEQRPPRLTGIILSPGTRRAIFMGRNDHPITVGQNEMVEDWRVTRIGADTVMVTKEQLVLSLHPGLLTGLAALPSPSAARDRWVTPAPHGVLRAHWSNPQLQP
jgi:hypothetical protein